MFGPLVGFVLALIWWTPRAAAVESFAPRELAWRAPAGCVDREQARRTIEQWLRNSVEPLDARALAVDAEVQRERERWVLALTLTSPSGRTQGQFVAQSCAPLLEVVALKVALAASSGAPLTTLDAPPPSRTASPARGALRASVGGLLGVLPGVSSSFGFGGAVRFSVARFELGVLYAPPRTEHYDEITEVGASLQLLAGTGRGCATIALRKVELPMCFGAELGVMRGQGVGTSQRFSSDQLFGDVVLGPALRWTFARTWSAWLELDGSIAFLRPSYHVRNLPGLYQVPVAGARAAVAIEWGLF